MTLAPAERQPAPYVAARAAHGGALSLGQMTPYEAWMFCESLANTPLLPDAYRKQPASVLWAMEYGRALGLDVVTTITTIHVIKGKPTQSADLMLGRARSAGHRVRIKSERDWCTVAIQRHDDPDDETVIEWTLDDAVTACLCELRDGRPYARDKHGDPTPWEKFPRAMLRSRAIAECVRSACPEVLHGAIYTPEELGAVVDQQGNTVEVEVGRPVPEVIEHTVQTPPPPPPAVPSRDYLAEAREASASAVDVLRIYRAAEGEGAPKAYLDQIAAVGRDKKAAELAAAEAELAAAALQHPQSPPASRTAPPAPAPVPAPAAAAHGLAVVDMYAAGRDVALTPDEVRQAFTENYRHGVDTATLAELAEITADMRHAAAGGAE